MKITGFLIATAIIAGLTGCAAPVGEPVAAPTDPPVVFEEDFAPYLGPRTGVDLPNAPTSDNEWAIYGNSLKSKAEDYKIVDPPQVDVAAWILPEEGAQFRDPCIAEQGFQQMPDGAWVGVSGDQESAFLLARYVCIAKYPSIPKYIAPLTEKHLSVAYDWTVETEIPCLESHGYVIEDVPTRAVYIATWFSKPFFPYEQIVSQSGDGTTFEELNIECPQWPPSEVLYAD